MYPLIVWLSAGNFNLTITSLQCQSNLKEIWEKAAQPWMRKKTSEFYLDIPGKKESAIKKNELVCIKVLPAF